MVLLSLDHYAACNVSVPSDLGRVLCQADAKCVRQGSQWGSAACVAAHVNFWQVCSFGGTSSFAWGCAISQC